MSYLIKRYAPAVAAIAMTAIAWFNLPDWEAELVVRGRSIDNAMGPLFDLATFSAGSLFAIYVLALARGGGFLGKILGTQTFQAFHRYVSSAILICVALSIYTAVLMIWGQGSLVTTSSLLASSLWMGFSAWALLAVARVGIIFLVIVGAGGSRHTGTSVSVTA